MPLQRTDHHDYPLHAAAAVMRCPPAGLTVPVRAHGQHFADGDEEVLPIWSGRFEAPDPAKLKRSAPLGGKTLGDELGERLCSCHVDELCSCCKWCLGLSNDSWAQPPHRLVAETAMLC